MRHAFAAVLSVGFLAGATTSIAHAQLLTRTWVSGIGNNANTCARTAPCLTFAGALVKTAAGGEISVLDPGSYGAVTITKSITIDGTGTLAGITSTGTNAAIEVTAGANDVVILRSLEIDGTGIGTHGVRFNSGKQLVIENTTIAGFLGSVVLVLPMIAGAAGNVVISNSTIAGAPGGSTLGVNIGFGTALVSHSLITGNGHGLFAQGRGTINADSNVLTYNEVAVQAGNGSTGQSAATVRLSNNDVYNNLTGFGCGGGVLASAGNNRKGSNTGGTAAVCSPTVVITQQ